ncbi:hypothetical protein MP228_003459 [Amoeboaphelidium protococcarum]|nr:hypothetical protein MP228_003459 [Amoeboaphelidium protococcarum]
MSQISKRQKMHIHRTIKLNDTETKICQLLKSAAALLTSKLQLNQPLTLRIAGGWVRDKLLNKDSKDIDVAIDQMTGHQFAMHMKSLINDRELSQTAQIPVKELEDVMRSIHQIKANPDKSKHLETTVVKLFGQDVDLVNLRKETYASHSRVPHIEFGTPLEDAERRDLAINSLFYNIATEEVEDFLGTGIDDLENGIIRTPLSPFVTFKDDPLRVLRAIRFAARYNFRIVKEIKLAAQERDIMKSFATIISRERVGEEMKKMLSGTNPLLALEYIVSFDLYNLIFSDGQQVDIDRIDQYEALKALKVVEMSRSTVDKDFGSKQDIFLLNLAAASLPLQHKYPLMNATVASIIQNAFKYSNVESQVARRLITARQTFTDQSAKLFCISNEELQEMPLIEYKALRLDLYKLIVQIAAKPVNDAYPQLLWFAMAMRLLNDVEVKDEQLAEAAQYAESTIIYPTLPSSEQLLLLSKDYSNLVEIIKLLNLQECHLMKPMIDGGELLKMVNDERQKSGRASIKSGKWLGKCHQQMLFWQAQHGGPRTMQQEYNKDACFNHVYRFIQNEL